LVIRGSAVSGWQRLYQPLTTNQPLVSAVSGGVEPHGLPRDGALRPFTVFDLQTHVDIQILVAAVVVRAVVLEEVAGAARNVDIADLVGLAVGDRRRADRVGVDVEPRHAARCAGIDATIVVAAAAECALVLATIRARYGKARYRRRYRDPDDLIDRDVLVSRGNLHVRRGRDRGRFNLEGRRCRSGRHGDAARRRTRRVAIGR